MLTRVLTSVALYSSMATRPDVIVVDDGATAFYDPFADAEGTTPTRAIDLVDVEDDDGFCVTEASANASGGLATMLCGRKLPLGGGHS